MTLAGTLFYLLAAAALAAALAAASSSKLRTAALAHAIASVAVAALAALLGAAVVAALLAVIAAVEIYGLRRLASVVADDAQAREVEDPPVGRLAAAISVIGFLLLASRVVLMARWPLGDSERHAATALAEAGLPHFLMVALLLFAAGLFIVATRRNLAGAWIGIDFAAASAVLALVAVSRFVGGAAGGDTIAAVAVVIHSLPRLALLLRRPGVFAAVTAPSGAAERSAASAMTALAALTLALLAGAW